VNPNQITEQAKVKLIQVEAHFEEELKKIRTGRAHPSMLDGIHAHAYGVNMPLMQLASITAPEAQLLQITPFDPSNINAISEAIRSDQALGLNPMDDGRVVRIPIPPLTTERRQEITKQLKEKVEEAMIAARNARHDALNDAKQQKIDKKIGEDDYLRVEKQVDDLMAATKQKVEALAESKEKEIMTI
jgi:ribosome recycling factor